MLGFRRYDGRWEWLIWKSVVLTSSSRDLEVVTLWFTHRKPMVCESKTYGLASLNQWFLKSGRIRRCFCGGNKASPHI